MQLSSSRVLVLVLEVHVFLTLFCFQHSQSTSAMCRQLLLLTLPSTKLTTSRTSSSEQLINRCNNCPKHCVATLLLDLLIIWNQYCLRYNSSLSYMNNIQTTSAHTVTKAVWSSKVEMTEEEPSHTDVASLWYNSTYRWRIVGLPSA